MDELCGWLLNGANVTNPKFENRKVHTPHSLRSDNARKRVNSRKRKNSRKKEYRSKWKKEKWAKIKSLKDNEQSIDGKEVSKNLFAYSKFFVKATERETPPVMLNNNDGVDDEHTIPGSSQKISTPEKASANTEANAMEDFSKDVSDVFSTDQNGVPHLDRAPYFQCAYCDQRFSLRGILSEHIVAEHRTKDKPKPMEVEARPVGKKSLRCTVCSTAFLEEESFEKHISTHHVNKLVHLFYCENCHKSFFTDALRKKHLNTVHNRPKSFCCKKCPQSFYNARSLSRHVVLKHPEEANFQCQECGKRFVYEFSLTSHKYIHSKKKKMSSV